jgi:tRNA(fMet)-specific endonuclease VapC
MTSPAYLLDSNVCVYLLQATNEKLKRRISKQASGSLVTSAIVYGEVGLGIDRDNAGLVAGFNRLFEVVPILPFDDEAARTYWSLPFRRGKFDQLIAAHALSLGLVLVSANMGDFKSIAGLKTEDWTR